MFFRIGSSIRIETYQQFQTFPFSSIINPINNPSIQSLSPIPLTLTSNLKLQRSNITMHRFHKLLLLRKVVQSIFIIILICLLFNQADHVINFYVDVSCCELCLVDFEFGLFFVY
jgi:hypothetical protein